MAGSKNCDPASAGWYPSPRSPGPLGSNCDGGDPDTPGWFTGDTPGPVGFQDYGDPDSPMRNLKGVGAPPAGLPPPSTDIEPTGVTARDFIKQYLKSMPSQEERWVAEQSFTREDIKPFIAEAELRVKMFTRDENALIAEIEKVRKDLVSWEDVKAWYTGESARREVKIAETNNKFNDLRWGGAGKKIGGINAASGGEVVINDEFRDANPPVIVEGYVRHEQVHRKNFNNMNVAGAFFGTVFGSIKYGSVWGESWVSGKHIEDELEAHQTHKQFYEEILPRINSERLKAERLLRALRDKERTLTR